MSRRVRRKSSKQGSGRRRSRYTPAEIFLALLGGLILIMVVGIIITSILGD